MLASLRQILISQFEASLATLGHCVTHCPESLWHAPVAKYPFSQVAFHTLFFADLYLGPDVETQRQQPFHQANPQLFGDYEQLQDRDPTSLYERSAITTYLEFCRQKAASTLAAETEATLNARCGFDWRNCSRAELHIYNIRHIQHHAAQLILRPRLDTDLEIPWFGGGWRVV